MIKKKKQKVSDLGFADLERTEIFDLERKKERLHTRIATSVVFFTEDENFILFYLNFCWWNI